MIRGKIFSDRFFLFVYLFSINTLKKYVYYSNINEKVNITNFTIHKFPNKIF